MVTGLDGATDAIDIHRNIPTANPILGKAMRLPGFAFHAIGAFYPAALFSVRRIGFPDNTTMEAYGHQLLEMCGMVDMHATYRFQIIGGALAGEYYLRWRSGLGSVSLRTEDFVNILRLGQVSPAPGRLMMFVYYADEQHLWVVAHQEEGKEYSMAECFEVMGVPNDYARHVESFGPLAWKVGGRIPELYLGKDMPVEFVMSKVKEVMR